MNKFEQGPMGSAPEQNEQDVEKEFNEYGQKMQDALADLMVELSEQKSQPSDIKTAMKESLILNRIFDSVLSDLENNLDIDALQEEVDKRVRLLRLDPSKFDLHKWYELKEKNRE